MYEFLAFILMIVLFAGIGFVIGYTYGHNNAIEEAAAVCQYEIYKRDWCDARGYKLEDMDEEVGINGECYACFDEWYNDEYAESRGE